MQIYLVRSENSALRSAPIHAFFTEADEAAEAVDLFAETEKNHLKELWSDKWSLFSSRFYVEAATANIPAQQLAEGMYPDPDEN